MNATHAGRGVRAAAGPGGRQEGDISTTAPRSRARCRSSRRCARGWSGLEHAFFSLIPANRYVRFDSDALLKTDLKTRTEIYYLQRNIGLRTIDEMRDLEDLEPLPGRRAGRSSRWTSWWRWPAAIRGIPNSMLPGLTLEMDLAADRLKKLQDRGLAGPTCRAGRSPSPEQVLGRIVGAAAGRPGAQGRRTRPGPGFPGRQPGPVRPAGRRGPQEDGGTEPEYVGAWIPHPASWSINGNGRH